MARAGCVYRLGSRAALREIGVRWVTTLRIKYRGSRGKES